MRCARCLIEYDDASYFIVSDGMDLQEAIECGLAFCVMCIVPQGSPAEV